MSWALSEPGWVGWALSEPGWVGWALSESGWVGWGLGVYWMLLQLLSCIGNIWAPGSWHLVKEFGYPLEFVLSQDLTHGSRELIEGQVS